MFYKTSHYICRMQLESEIANNNNRDNEVETHESLKRTLCIRTKHNRHIFWVISFIKLQNNTLITIFLLNLFCVWIFF